MVEFVDLVIEAVCGWVQHGLDQRVRSGTPFIGLKRMHTTRRQRLHLISTRF